MPDLRDPEQGDPDLGDRAAVPGDHSRARVLLTVPPVDCHAVIDLDLPAVREGLHSLTGGDLLFGAGDICGPDKLQPQGAEFFGTGPSVEPGPDECARAARAEASGPVLTRAMRAGETAFCVITNQDNIAWVLVTAASRDPGTGLSLTVTLWTPNP